jgi:predicted RND superfamily exporter protein
MDEKTKNTVGKYFKILFGLLLIVVGVSTYATWGRWWPELLILIKGSIGAVVALIGLMFMFIGFSD